MAASWVVRTLLPRVVRTLLPGAALLVIATSSATSARTQRADSLARITVPGTITGVVVDTAGRPVEDAVVVIASERRQTRSARDGSFQIGDLRPGRYALSARRIGYYPQTRDVVVGDIGGSVRFGLVPLAQGLPAKVVVATRRGLAGVVSDTAFAPLAKATIQVIGTSSRAESNAAGAFYMDVRPGSYLVRVQRAGFSTQLVSVTISETRGREVAIWMAPATRGSTAREGVAAFDMSRRIMWRHPASSRVFSREDMDKLNIDDLPRLSTVGAGQPVDERCEAYVDGGPFKVPIWSLNTADLEFVEVYSSGIGRSTPASQRSKPDACGVKVYAWLRK